MWVLFKSIKIFSVNFFSFVGLNINDLFIKDLFNKIFLIVFFFNKVRFILIKLIIKVFFIFWVVFVLFGFKEDICDCNCFVKWVYWNDKKILNFSIIRL